MKFNSAQFEPYISVSAAPAPKTPTLVPKSYLQSEFEREAESLTRDITDIWFGGCRLRDEACRLVVWVNQGCGKSWWGASQDARVARTRANLRIAAAAWKSEVDKRPN